jgi:hypothetical protein
MERQNGRCIWGRKSSRELRSTILRERIIFAKDIAILVPLPSERSDRSLHESYESRSFPFLSGPGLEKLCQRHAMTGSKASRLQSGSQLQAQLLCRARGQHATAPIFPFFELSVNNVHYPLDPPRARVDAERIPKHPFLINMPSIPEATGVDDATTTYPVADRIQGIC